MRGKSRAERGAAAGAKRCAEKQSRARPGEDRRNVAAAPRGRAAAMPENGRAISLYTEVVPENGPILAQIEVATLSARNVMR